MTEFQKGDVVLVAIDASGGKRRRPAVVVHVHQSNGEPETLSVIPLTSNAARAKDNPESQILVKMNSSEGRAGGLRMDCSIECSFVAQVPKNLIVGKLGRFPSSITEEIDKRLLQ